MRERAYVNIYWNNLNSDRENIEKDASYGYYIYCRLQYKSGVQDYALPVTAPGYVQFIRACYDTDRQDQIPRADKNLAKEGIKLGITKEIFVKYAGEDKEASEEAWKKSNDIIEIFDILYASDGLIKPRVFKVEE